MSIDPHRLKQGLEALGALLDAVGQSVELAIVGGGALVLSGVHVRPTEDLDVVAQKDGEWHPSSPLPADVVQFARDVGRAYDLPVKTAQWGTDWLNAGPSFLMPDDLPPGFFARTSPHNFGGLTLHVPCRADLTTLKVLSATSTGRGAGRGRDLQDLVQLTPSADQLAAALEWAAKRRPSPDFWGERAHALLDDLEAAGLAAAAAARVQCYAGRGRR